MFIVRYKYITPLFRVLLEKTLATQLVKKPPTLYETQKSIILITTVQYWPKSEALCYIAIFYLFIYLFICVCVWWW